MEAAGTKLKYFFITYHQGSLNILLNKLFFTQNGVALG